MEKILILDFGGQYNQLIARRVRELQVYCELQPHTTTLEEIRRFDPIGVIFTGGPGSVYLPDAPKSRIKTFCMFYVFPFMAASTSPTNSGCGRLGRLLNSGWNCTPTKKRLSVSSTASTMCPSGDRPHSRSPAPESVSR